MDLFHILALDGGGTRGIYTAQLLANIERTFGIRVQDCFSLVAGTSAGAIVAGAAATGIPMQQIVHLFEKEVTQIFRKRWLRHPLFFSRYPKKVLEHTLAKHLPAVRLSEITTPLLITCSNLISGRGQVFRAPNAGADDIDMRQAILASCAAPTFFDPNPVRNTLLADGSFWANNPSIAALTEAISTLGQAIEKIKILSIGTGHPQNMYRNRRNWGLITGWHGQKIASYVLAIQSQATADMTQRLLKHRYLRINSFIDFWELDDTSRLVGLKHLADLDFEAETEKIKQFLDL